MPRRERVKYRGGTGKDTLTAQYAEIRSRLLALTRARRFLLREGIEVDIQAAVTKLEAKKLLLKRQELNKLQAAVKKMEQKDTQKS